MVPGKRPVIELVKLPVPGPSILFEFAIVGLCDVLQHTPLAVTDAPPSAEMLPPLNAVVEVIDDAAVVETVDKIAVVVNVCCTP